MAVSQTLGPGGPTSPPCSERATARYIVPGRSPVSLPTARWLGVSKEYIELTGQHPRKIQL